MSVALMLQHSLETVGHVLISGRGKNRVEGGYFFCFSVLMLTFLSGVMMDLSVK